LDAVSQAKGFATPTHEAIRKLAIHVTEVCEKVKDIADGAFDE
jgi:hypothetical protein